MSSQILKTIERIISLNTEIENFQQGEIDENKREREFQIKKLNNSIDYLISEIQLYKKWKNILELLPNKQKDEFNPLNELQNELNIVKIDKLNNKGLIELENQLVSFKKEITNQIEDIKADIKENLSQMKDTIQNALNLIKQFSSIPEIKTEIENTYKTYLKGSYDESDLRDLIKFMTNLSSDKLNKLEQEAMVKCIKIYEFSNSIYNTLDFSSIEEKFDLDNDSMINLQKIIENKNGISLDKLNLNSLFKLKEKIPQFYKRLYLKFE